jgi:hypothetical protein
VHVELMGLHVIQLFLRLLSLKHVHQVVQLTCRARGGGGGGGKARQGKAKAGRINKGQASC